MITSILMKTNPSINFTKVELDLQSGKMLMKVAKYDLTSEELLIQVEKTHRVCLPCRITDEAASFYVPLAWDSECIENYTQALLDELYLLNNNIEGHKTVKQIEASFMLEMVLV